MKEWEDEMKKKLKEEKEAAEAKAEGAKTEAQKD
jgi:hypothetical protein